MTEYQFIARNKDRWNAFEHELAQQQRAHPDRLCELYLTLIDDLSYARTHFQGSSLTAYLNQLAVIAHQRIYGTRQERKSRVVSLYRREIPEAFAKAWHYFAYALLVFLAAAVIGWTSGVLQTDFIRVILGDDINHPTQS